MKGEKISLHSISPFDILSTKFASEGCHVERKDRNYQTQCGYPN
jgi:hypothetical protein